MAENTKGEQNQEPGPQKQAKQGDRQGNQPGQSPDKGDLDKGVRPPSDVEDIEGADDIDDEPESKVTQRNPAEQGRDDQNK